MSWQLTEWADGLHKQSERCRDSLAGTTENGATWAGKIIIICLIVGVGWALTAFIEYEIMRARMLALVGSDTDPFSGDELSALIGVWHAAALAIFTAIFCDARGIGGKSVLFGDAAAQHRYGCWALCGLALTVATGISVVVASTESVVGLDDIWMQFILWCLYMVTAMLALFLGGFVLPHLLGFAWLILLVGARAVVGLLRHGVEALHGALDGLLEVLLHILALPAAIGHWLVRHLFRRRAGKTTPSTTTYMHGRQVHYLVKLPQIGTAPS